jgi:hypothetical protein
MGFSTSVTGLLMHTHTQNYKETVTVQRQVRTFGSGGYETAKGRQEGRERERERERVSERQQEKRKHSH